MFDHDRTTLATIVAANLLPLAGLVALDWSAASLLAVYWLELGVVIAWAVPKALLAERRLPENSGQFLRGLSRKRGGIELPIDDCTLSYRNVPVTVLWGTLTTVAWLGIGGALSLGTGTQSLALGVGAAGESSVLLAALGLFAGQAVEFWRQYVGEEHYEEVSAAVVWRKPLGFVGGVVVLATALNLFVVQSVQPVAALAVVVVAKSVYEVDASRRRRAGEWDTPFGLDWLGVDRRTNQVRAALPDDEPLVTARPRPAAISVGALSRGVLNPVGGYAALGVGVGGTSALASGSVWLLVLPLAALVATVAVAGGQHWLQFRHLEYRIHTDAVVAYDRAHDVVQWAMPMHAVEDARRVGTLEPRLVGTQTIRIEAIEHVERDALATNSTTLYEEGTDYRLAHVENHEAVYEAVERWTW